MRYELLIRLDELVIFRPLRKAQLRTIALLALRALTGRLKARQISLHLPDDALGVLVDLGWNPEYGARPLKRTIQKVLPHISPHRPPYLPLPLDHHSTGARGAARARAARRRDPRRRRRRDPRGRGVVAASRARRGA